MSRAARSPILACSRPAAVLFLTALALASPTGSGFSFAQDNSSKDLIDALKDADSSVRQTAATLLGRLGEQAPAAAVPALAGVLKDKDLDVRGAAVMALGRMGAKAKLATAKLADLLADPNRDIRCAAALSLARIGKDASEAVPKLTAMSQKDDKLERVYAVYALIVVGGGPDKADSRVRTLVDFLSDASPLVRGSAAYVLGELGTGARTAIPALTAALFDNEKDVRKAAADALAEMGPAAREAVPNLILLLQDKDHGVRSSAQAALLEMGLAAGRTGMFFLTRTLNQKTYNQILAEYEADAEKTGEAKGPMKRLAEIQAFFENAQSIEVFRLLPTPDKQMKKVSFEAADADHKAAAARAETARKQYETAVENTGKPSALSEKELAVLRSNYLGAVIDAEDKLQVLSRAEKDKLPAFHGHEVYGQTAVDKVERRELTAFLQKSLHWDPYRQLPGFKAHYGLRAVQGKRTIDMVISTESNRINVFEGNEAKGTITILAGKSQILEDLLRATTRKNVEFEPGEINFGVVHRGETPTQTIDVLHSGGASWRLDEIVKNSNAPFDLRVEDLKGRLGAGKTGYRIFATIQADAAVGEFKQEVLLKTNDAAKQMLSFYISGNIQANLPKKEPVKKEPEKKKEADIKKEPEKKKEADIKKEPEKKKQEPIQSELKFVNSTKVALTYDLADVGPSGVSQVELWFTLDGQTWSKYDGKYAGDQKSLTFDVVGEGRYGVSLVARSGVGRAQKPPQNGDRPQLWFEVDTTRPVVKLDTPVVGEGADSGKVFITWSASDKNLEREPVTLFYAQQPSGPWQPIKGAEKLAGSGRFVWTLPDNPPFQFYVKAEALDRARNVGEAVTVERISVDLSTPRAIISGGQVSFRLRRRSSSFGGSEQVAI